MLIKKVLVLLSLLVMFGSARAGMTSSDSYNDWNIGLFGYLMGATGGVVFALSVKHESPHIMRGFYRLLHHSRWISFCNY